MTQLSQDLSLDSMLVLFGHYLHLSLKHCYPKPVQIQHLRLKCPPVHNSAAQGDGNTDIATSILIPSLTVSNNIVVALLFIETCPPLHRDITRCDRL